MSGKLKRFTDYCMVYYMHGVLQKYKMHSDCVNS